MAIWPLNGVVQLLIFVYNFISLAYLIEAQILYPPSVQVSTSWTVPSPMGADRIILFNGKPSARLALNKRVGFACGFYSRSTQANSFFFAVGTALEDLASGEDHVYFDKVVWLANRNKPVGQNATLQLLPDGNLVLEDADGSFVWSTDTANKTVAGMKMMDTGNLVLHDIHNKTIWQSFDHPTDTLLLGQKLVAGKKLVASVSETIMSEGNFSFSVTFKGLFAFYQVNVPQMYLNFDVSDGVSQENGTDYNFIYNVGRIELNYHNDEGVLTLSIFSTDGAEFYFHYKFLPAYTNTTVSRVKFDPDGHLRLYLDQYESTDEYQPVDLLETQLDKCDYPTVCGNYGLCSYGQCTCPAGFAQDRDSGSEFSCSEINPGPTICEYPQSQFLLSLEDTYYFNYVDKEAAVLKETDVETCKQACMENCSCKAALFQLDIHNFFGNCYLPSPVLSFITDGKGKHDYNSSAFIKISNKGESGGPSDAIPKSEGSGTGRGSSASAIRTEIIAGSTIGTFLLMCLTVGFWIVILRNKGDGEEGMEDCLDQLSGMPKRFAYIELKVATWEFQKKLGEGGFGSVFEGILENGEKIAVKRLDALGQGKKEFLAEVKTIGSIHHVNLVRLIGFCAEKLHRLLAYEFMCNGSLDKWIFHKELLRPPLDWQTRRKIILDIAKGLAYLHEDCIQRIVHLDIKPQNILLDANLHAKISDFGLSRLIERDQSQVVTTTRGTPGYMAPELFSSVITEKADIYSYGIVVMEIVCGRKNLDRSQPFECMHLLPLFMRKAEEDQLMDMVDKSSEDMQLHWSEAVEMMRVAIWCLQSDYTRRPSMSTVVKALEGTMEVEADLNYTIQHPTTMAAIRREAELEITPTLLLPSLLSGPR